MADHDHSYKAFFSDPRMVADLLVGFCPGSWVSHLDLSSLEKVSGNYVGVILAERHDDVVWRVRSRQSRCWVYLYFLVEFQSQVEYFMAVRIMGYVALLYQDLIAQKLVLPGQLLPRIEPIVLYNGSELWGAAEDIHDLIQCVEGLPDADRPGCRYRLVVEHAYPRERLEQMQNVAATLFLLEQARGPDDVCRGIERLLQELEQEPGLRRVFLAWLRQVLLPARFPGVAVSQVNSLNEVRNMLAERVKEWTQQWYSEGVGVGQRSLTQRLLEKRFGPLTAEQQARVQAGDPEAILERLFTAASLDEVLGEQPPRDE